MKCLTWVDRKGNTEKFETYFGTDYFDTRLAGKSKGLKQIASELGVEVCAKAKLSDYKRALLEHPAFAVSTKLENLGKKYGVKVVFNPKYHCELNPIESVWCHLKWYVRKHTDQTFLKLKSLLESAREDYAEKKHFMKHIKRFWNCLDAYSKGASYGTIMWTYFSGKRKEKVESHRKIHEKNQ